MATQHTVKRHPFWATTWMCLVASSFSFGCHPPALESSLLGHQDTPYSLAVKSDLSDLRDQYWKLSATRAPGWRAKRSTLANEYARRLRTETNQGRFDRGFQHFVALLGLWEESHHLSHSPGLRQFREEAEIIRATFARRGGEMETVTALAALALMEPSHASKYLSEIEEVIAYSDALAVSQFGEGSQMGRAIDTLNKAAHSIGYRPLIKRLVTLYQQRQKSLTSHLQRTGPTYNLLRAHGESVLRSSWHIVTALIRARRFDHALAAISTIRGLGEDASLRETVAATQAAASVLPFMYLADAVLAAPGDPAAAYMICRRAIDRFPKSIQGYTCAGKTAKQQGRFSLAAHWLEKALQLNPNHSKSALALAQIYDFRISTLSHGGRPNAAAQVLKNFIDLAKSYGGSQPLDPNVASGWASLGHGLLSNGQLQLAERYLRNSLETQANQAAHEHLSLLAHSQGNYKNAVAQLDAALELPVTTASQAYQHNKLLRLRSEAHLAAGEEKLAYNDAVRGGNGWHAFLAQYQATPALRANALLEQGKLLWYRDQLDLAISAFDASLAIPDGTAQRALSIVAFLLHQKSIAAATDIVHWAIGTFSVSDSEKVYLSLWILAENRRLGQKDDPAVVEFLRARQGTQWDSRLAAMALGKATAAKLRAEARTKDQKVELHFYSAVLSSNATSATMRTHLQRVVQSRRILLYEHALAQRWLALM